jgi:hypothetical protein
MSLFPDLPLLSSPPAKPKLSAEDRRARRADPSPKDWPALYAAGSSLAQIADRTGYPATHVRQELLVRGVVLRRPGVRLGSRQRSSGWHAAAATMRAHGYCYAAIARELGQSPAAVRGALVRQAEDDVGHHRAYLARMSLPPDQPPPATPKMSAEERRLRHEDRLKTIRLRMLIFQELDQRDITTLSAIGDALGMPATEAVKLLRGQKWREGDVALLQVAAARLGVQVRQPPGGRYGAS